MNIGSTTGSSFTVGTQGVQAGSEQLNRAAHQVVSASTDRPATSVSEVSDGVVAQHQAEIQVKASAQVIEAADQQQQTIIDIHV